MTIRARTTFVVVSLIAAACGGSADSTPEAVATSTTEASSTTVATKTNPPASETTTTAVTTTSTAAPPTTAAPEPPLVSDGNSYTINWGGLKVPPFWSPANASEADPKFFIHTSPEADGFYFALELYTTGYGQLWTGELGPVQIICNEPLPGPNSTGICPLFDPDGPGPQGNLNADFGATGSITINKLDDGGYDIVVNEIVFSDGSLIDEFTLTGP